MSLPNLLYFYRRRLRARLVQELLALAGIAVGVALLFAVQVSNQSLGASVVQYTEGLLGNANLQVVGRDGRGFDEEMIASVGEVPGVIAAAPSLEVSANVVGPDGERSVTVLAADERLTGMGGSLFRGYESGRLTETDALVLPAHVAEGIGVSFGGTVGLQVRGRTVRAPVLAVVDEEDVGPVARSPVAIVPLEYGQRLTQMGGRISHLYLQTDPAAESEVSAAVARVVDDGLDVKTAAYERDVFGQLAMPTERSTSLFAGISALVGFVFAFNAMLLMARERRSVIAELRLSGFGVGTVVQVLLFDALVLGVTASAIGLGLGELLSRHLFDPAPGFLAYAFPVGTARVVEWPTAALAAGAGIGAALLATLLPLSAMRADRPLDAIEDDRMDGAQSPGRVRPTWLFVGALVLVAVTLAILVAAPRLAILGMVTLIGAMLLGLPAVLLATLRLGNAWRRHANSVVPTVAVGELLSARSRSVALAAIIAVAVFGSTAIEAAHRDLENGLDTVAHEFNADAGIWISARGATNQLATVSFPQATLREVEDVPEVTDVREYRGGFLDIGERRTWVIAPSPDTPEPVPRTQIVEGDVGIATERVRAGGWVVLSEAVAADLGAVVGDVVTLPSPHPTRLRLAAISSNLGWAAGSVLLNAEDHARAWGTNDVSALQVPAERLGQGALAARIEQALGPNAPFEVQTAREREEVFRAATRAGLTRLTQIATMVLLAAACAMAAAMAGMIWQRRRRLADLKLIGIDERALWRALMLETTVLLAVGSVVGAAMGLVGQQLLDRALSTVTGFPIEYSVGVGVAATSLGVVAAVALALAALPGYVAARVPTSVAFQD